MDKLNNQWDSALNHVNSSEPVAIEQLWARRLKSKSEKAATAGISPVATCACAADHRRYSSESCPALFTPLAAGNSRLDRTSSETSPSSESMACNREWRSCLHLVEDQTESPAIITTTDSMPDVFKHSRLLQRQPAISSQLTARFDTFLSTDIPCSPNRRRLNAHDVRIQITGATFDHSSFDNKSSQESICNLDTSAQRDHQNVLHDAKGTQDIDNKDSSANIDPEPAGVVPLMVPAQRPRSAPSFDFIDEASNWHEFGKTESSIPDSAVGSSTIPTNESFDSTADAVKLRHATKSSAGKTRCLSTGATSSSEWDVSLDSTDSDRKADSVTGSQMRLSNSNSSLVKSVSTPDICAASGRNLLPAHSTEDQTLLHTDSVSFDDNSASVPTSPPSHVLVQELFARYLRDRILRDRAPDQPQFARFSYPSFFSDTNYFGCDGASLPVSSGDPSEVRLSLSEALNDPSMITGKAAAERSHLSTKLTNGRASSTDITEDSNQRRSKGKVPDARGLGLAGIYGTQGRSLSSSSFNLSNLPHNANQNKGATLQSTTSVGGAGNLVKKLKKEKIRRSSRIFGIGGSKSKKTKEEAKRCQQTHSFVSVSFSNTTPCQICGKPLANKSASQCQNCLLTCHDNNCLEQIDACPFASRTSTTSVVSPATAPAPSVVFSLRNLRSGDRSLSSGQSGTPGTPSTPISPSSGSIGNGTGVQLPSVVIEKMMAEHGYAVDNLADATSLGLIDPKNLTAAVPLKRLSVPSSFESSTNTLAGSGVQSQSDSSLSASSPASSRRPVSPGSFSRWKYVADKLLNKPTSCTTDTHADSDSDDISLATNATNISENVVAHAESKDVLLLPYAKLLDFDPELRIAVPEAEAWSMTQDKEFLVTLSEREIKRQDIIYELIQTEKNHCAVLLIIDQIYIRGLRNELQWSETEIHKFFPSFTDILDVHIKFLRQLRQRQQQSRVIECIGDILIEQFDGERGQRMKKAYGEFCSHHKEAGQIYKSKLNKDRRFAAFDTKCIDKLKCHSSRFDILSCILLVTQRISKYRLLIESIYNKTDAESPDKKLVGLAFECIKHVLTYVDASIGSEERRKRLNEIYRAMDSKSSTVIQGEEWKKHQLFDRALIFDGPVQFRKASGKLVDIQALLLSDCIVFLQESNQKFTFAHVDDKPAVVPLNRVIIRPKAERSGMPEKSLFLISSGMPLNIPVTGSFIAQAGAPHSRAEMYELICNSVKECEKWRVEITGACATLRQQEEIGLQETVLPLDGSVDEVQLRRMREVISNCQAKDKTISRLCDEKCDLLREAADAVGLTRGRLSNIATSASTGALSPLLSAVISEDNLATEQLQTVLASALNELSRLMPAPLPSGTLSPLINCDSNAIPPAPAHLSRPPAGPSNEDLRLNYELALSPTPKRAETFGGYDVSNKEMINANRSISMKDNGRARPRPATTNITQHLQQNTPPNSKLSTAWSSSINSTWTSRDSCATADYSSSSAISSSPSSSPRMSVALPDEHVSGSVTHSVPLNAYLHSVVQLHWYLNQIADAVVHQSTAHESLATKYVESQQKMAAMETRDRKQNKHAVQLEELRSLQEAFMKEKNQYLSERENENQWLKQKRQELDRETAKVKADKEDMDRQRNALFAQCEKLRENGLDVVLNSNPPYVQIFPNGLDMSHPNPKSPLPAVREENKPSTPGLLVSLGTENRPAQRPLPAPPPPPMRTLSASTLPPRPPLSSSHSLNTIRVPGMPASSPTAPVETVQTQRLPPGKEAKLTFGGNWKGSMESLHKKAETAKEKLRNFVDNSPSPPRPPDRVDSPYLSSNSLSVHPAGGVPPTSGKPRPTVRAASEAKLGITNLLHLSEKTSVSPSGSDRDLKKKSSEKKRFL